ncbi:hypothetical protein LT493_33970 [Streptomyces tricolor]|nr:hypothetical protein [Streptomyces tricolor]
MQKGPVVRGQADRDLRQHARPVFPRAGGHEGGGQGPWAGPRAGRPSSRRREADR